MVPLAAALSIPLTSASGAPLPERDLVLVLATAVIVVSLIVQGLTLEPLARFAGITRPATGRHLQARIGHTRARIDGTPAPEPGGLTDSVSQQQRDHAGDGNQQRRKSRRRDDRGMDDLIDDFRP